MARPTTPKQWQDAVDAAYLIHMVQTGQVYELLGDMPAFDFEKIFQTLEEGREQGITPMADIIELQDAAAALLEKIDTHFHVLRETQLLGASLERLRMALNERRKKELYFYAHRKAS
jgi:hypothetical protein